MLTAMLYYPNITVHVLAAMLWLGGMFFLGIVGAPLMRAIEPPELRQRLFTVIGERFRAVGWWAIAVLVLTGVVNLHYRGWLHWDGVLGSQAFWRTGPGRTLAAKLSAVTTMIVIAAVHDFIQGPRAGKAAPGSPEAIAFRRRAALLARVNAIVGVLLVAAAVRLARGG
jgi:putative copper resistance protein D